MDPGRPDHICRPVCGHRHVFGSGASTAYAIRIVTCHLYRVDVVTPANSVDLGAMPAAGEWRSLGGVANNLYAINSNDRLYRVDLVTPANSVDLGAMPAAGLEYVFGRSCEQPLRHRPAIMTICTGWI